MGKIEVTFVIFIVLILLGLVSLPVWMNYIECCDERYEEISNLIKEYGNNSEFKSIINDVTDDKKITRWEYYRIKDWDKTYVEDLRMEKIIDSTKSDVNKKIPDKL